VLNRVLDDIQHQLPEQILVAVIGRFRDVLREHVDTTFGGQRLQGMPTFQVLNPVREVKPGASIIATVSDETGKSFPALVVQRKFSERGMVNRRYEPSEDDGG
jgi:hypothetical protein